MRPGERLLTVLYFLISITLLSCNKSDDIGDDIELVDISIHQRFVDGRTEPYLLGTGGNYGCQGVPIAFDFYNTGEVLYLNFGATYGKPCGGSYNSHHALAYIYPGRLQNGNYMFEITNKGQTLHSILKVEDNKYTVENGWGATVAFDKDLLVCNLTPQDAIWGHVESVSASNAQDFLDSLYSLGAVQYAPLLENGSYYYYTIEGGEFISHQWSCSNCTYFLLKSAFNTATLQDVVNYFTSNYIINSAEIKTGKGEFIQ